MLWSLPNWLRYRLATYGTNVVNVTRIVASAIPAVNRTLLGYLVFVTCAHAILKVVCVLSSEALKLITCVFQISYCVFI